MKKSLLLTIKLSKEFSISIPILIVDGALSEKTKEMSCSMVLRYNDCVKYHLKRCFELGINSAEIQEIFSVATFIGGTIVIPHLRRATEYWEELIKQ